VDNDVADVEEEVHWGIGIGEWVLGSLLGVVRWCELIEDEVGGGVSGGGSGVSEEVAFHASPSGSFVGEHFAKVCGECAWGVGEVSAVEVAQESEVALFLAGDEVVDEHGAGSGEGFVDGGAACFSYDEVVAGEEFGDFSGPPFDGDALGEVGLDFQGAGAEFFFVATQDDG